MCNPGGAAALLDVRDDMCLLYPGVTMRDFEQQVGRELGVGYVLEGSVRRAGERVPICQV